MTAPFSPIRVAGVGYLNTEPLVWELEGEPADKVRLERASPSRCAELLRDGRADAGLIPVMAYEERWRVLPGVSIACDGPAESVLLAGHVPAPDMKRVALDPASRTAAALLKVLFREHWKREPRFEEAEWNAPDFDGRLVIGDPALHLPMRESAEPLRAGAREPAFEHVYDLGSEWKTMTGLPFVFAFWAGVDNLPPRARATLRRAKAEGLCHVRDIAERYAAGHQRGAAFYARYLGEVMRYGLGQREMEGLKVFYWAAHKTGLLPKVPVIRFYED